MNVQVILIDNSSKADEVFDKQLKYGKVFIGVKNDGFGAACNFGAVNSDAEYLLFLNTDTEIKEDALFKTLEYVMKNDKTGALGIKTMLPNGKLDHACKRGFPTPFNSVCYFLKLDEKYPNEKRFGGYRLLYLDSDTTAEVDSVSGSFLMVRTDTFNMIGGFDTTFFMYGEDIDLCYRIKEKGYKNIYFADTDMIHYKGQSGLHTKSKVVIKHFYNAMNIFFDKHYKNQYGFFVYLIAHLAIWTKCQLTLMRSAFSK